MRTKFETLDQTQMAILTNALNVAARDFTQNAKDMGEARQRYEAATDAARAEHDKGMIHGRAYALLEKQMSQQAEDVAALLNWLEGEDLTDENGEGPEVMIGRQIERNSY